MVCTCWSTFTGETKSSKINLMTIKCCCGEMLYPFTMHGVCTSSSYISCYCFVYVNDFVCYALMSHWALHEPTLRVSRYGKYATMTR